MMNSAKRIAIVTGVPAPYREPVFERLANRPGVELKVFYCTHSHHNVAWSSEGMTSFEYVKEFPRNFTPKRFQRLPFFGYTNFGLSAALRDYEPDFVIVYGYNQSSHWMAFRYCLANDVPFALRSDSNVHIDLGLSWQSNIRRRLFAGSSSERTRSCQSDRRIAVTGKPSARNRRRFISLPMPSTMNASPTPSANGILIRRAVFGFSMSDACSLARGSIFSSKRLIGSPAIAAR